MQQSQEKEIRRKEQRKTESGKRVKPSTPTQANDVCMGDEEKNRRKNKRKKQGVDPYPATWTIWFPLMTLMDYMVGLF